MLVGLAATPYFEDVPESHPFFAQIQRMKERGITNGCSANPPRFCPDDTVTRGQLAAFLVRATEGAPGPVEPLTGGLDPGEPETGFVVFGQRITPLMAVGGILVLAAVLRR